MFNKIEILALPWWYFWVVFVAGTPIALTGGMLVEKGKCKLFKFIGWFIFIITLTSMMILGTAWPAFKQPTGRYEYTVSIEDPNVNVLDFNSKYEIVRQEGELWIIRDKQID